MNIPKQIPSFETGHLCLDFIATMKLSSETRNDILQTPEDLALWLAASGLYQAPPNATDHDLENAKTMRAAILAIIQSGLSGKQPDLSSLAVLNFWASKPPLVRLLSQEGTEAVWADHQPITAALTTIALDAIDLLTGSWKARIRECASPDCSTLFVDTSRPGKRRWCSMNTCGNKQKKQTFKINHQHYSE